MTMTAPLVVSRSGATAAALVFVLLLLLVSGDWGPTSRRSGTTTATAFAFQVGGAASSSRVGSKAAEGASWCAPARRMPWTAFDAEGIPLRPRRPRHRRPFFGALSLSSASPDEEGADLAAEFFKMAQEKGINLDPRDVVDDDDDDDDDEDEVDEDDEDDEPEPNIPQGAINAFLGYETVDVGEKLAGNVSLTDRQLYSEVKERVLDTAGGFVDFVKSARDDDDEAEDDDDDEDDGEGSDRAETKPYEVPTTVPDSDLTAGEVVILVLNALLNNDVPTPNRGVEILFGYSSEGSQIKNEVGLTPADYAEFLQETEYKVLFSHQGASIDKADYSFDGKKAFFTARLKTGPGPLDVVSVNFILSTKGVEDDACWLVDSMLIRPQSMRRRRRK